MSVVAGIALAGGVGIAAALGLRGSAENWRKWSDVGQTFGALSSIIGVLTLAAVVITAKAQFRELKRTAAAELRMMHLEILKMSVNDAELAEVWPAFHPNLSPTLNRQYLYANIIYQFHWTSLKLGEATDEQVLASMHYLFTNSIMRGYWAAAREARTSLEPGSLEHAFATRVDEICRNYEKAVATARLEYGAADTPVTATEP